jgi:hypothetical protein
VEHIGKIKRRLQILMRRFYFGEPCKEFYKYCMCTKEVFQNHINNQLQSDMNIENYGKLWELDHIVPVELFDIENEEDLKICYSRFNILPIYKKHNKAKSSSIHFSWELIKSRFIKDQENEILFKLKNKCLSELKQLQIYF